jgi:hypothetical protein
MIIVNGWLGDWEEIEDWLIGCIWNGASR